MADTDSLILKRLATVEDDLLEAIIDRPSLAVFDSRWSLLVDDVNKAIGADALSIETVHLAHSLSGKVADVVETFLNLEALSEQVMSSLTIDSSAILSSIPNLPTSSTSRSPSPDASDIPKPTPNTSLPPYVEPSYEWLLKNIHNPYPATYVRNRIAQDTGSERKDIDGWFIDFRKRIGWNGLRKSHFSNKRIEIIDAATRFFVQADPKRPLDPQVSYAFAKIEACAKSLYSKKLSKSNLATTLDMVVKDMTPEMKVQAKAEEQRRRLREKEEVVTICGVPTYPTPNCSPTVAPLSLPLADKDDMENNASQSIRQSSRKRRAASSSHSEWNAGGVSDRSIKRARIDSPSPTGLGSYVIGLPSPASSVHEPLATIDEASTPQQIIIPAAGNGSSRKRRLSGSDSRGSLKRPHTIHDGSSPQPISDPLPLASVLLDTTQLDDWFHNGTSFSNIPDVEALSTPFEVELFDFSQIYDQNQPPNTFQYPSPQAYDRLSPVSEVSETCAFDLDISTNTFNYQELFLPDDHSRVDQGHDVAQIAKASSVYGIPSPGVPLPPDTLNIYKSLSHTNDPAFIVDASSPVSENPATTFDWVFPSFISQSIAPEEDLFGFSRNIDMFGPSINATPLYNSRFLNRSTQMSIQANRAAKQQKLFEIQETARRLEAELAASPC